MNRAELRRRIEAAEMRVRRAAEVTEALLDFSLLSDVELGFVEACVERTGPGSEEWSAILKARTREDTFRLRDILVKLLDAPRVRIAKVARSSKGGPS